MFECDDDLGLDEPFTELFSQEDLDIIEASENQRNTNVFPTDQVTSLKQVNFLQNIAVDGRQTQNICKNDDKQTNNSRLKSTNVNIQSRNLSNPLISIDQGNINNSNPCRGSAGVNKFLENIGDLRPGSESANFQFAATDTLENNFTKPNCLTSRRNGGFSQVERNTSEQNSVIGNIFEDDDFSEVFTEDFTFGVEEERVKCVKIPDKSSRGGGTPRKRKFPGPAGILPESPNSSKSYYENRDDVQSIDIPNTDIPCTQDNSQFGGQLWLKMCADFSGGPTFVPHCFNIASIKKMIKSKAVQRHKAPFLAAIIIHVERFDCRKLNTFITLKDTSGQLNASLQSDLYETYKQDITVGSVIVLRDFSLLTLHTSANVYITITPKNLLIIYSESSSRQHETQTDCTQMRQTDCTQFARETIKVTKVQDVAIGNLIEDTLNFKYSGGNPCVRNITAVKFEREGLCGINQNINFCGITDKEKQANISNGILTSNRKIQENTTLQKPCSRTVNQPTLPAYNNIFNQQSNFKIMENPTTNTSHNQSKQMDYKSNHQSNCKSTQFQQDNGLNIQQRNSQFDIPVNSPSLNSMNRNSVFGNNNLNSRNIISQGSNKQNISFSKLKKVNNHCSSTQDQCLMNNQRIVNDNLITRDAPKANKRYSTVTTNDNENIALIQSDGGGNGSQLIPNRNFSNDNCNNRRSSSKIDVTAEVHMDAEGIVGKTEVLKAKLAQFRFKKRTNDKKENSEGNNSKLEENGNNANVNTNISKNNSEGTTFSQISLLSGDQEHSQILEEAFEGIDACSLLEEF